MGGADGALLVVDDDPGSARSLARLLPRWRVETVATTAEALGRCAGFDAFLVDVCLGLVDQHGGLKLARELRARLPRAAIVIVSGLVDRRTVDAQVLDIDGFLVKGDFSADQLRKAIAEARERRSGVAGQRDGVDALRVLRSGIEDALDAIALEQAATAERACTLARLARDAQKLPGPERRTLDAVGRELGVTRQTLLRYAQVARAWPLYKIRMLLQLRRNSKGQYITPCHLDAAARLAKTRRDAVLEEAFEKSLTVKETRRLGRKGK